MSYIKLNQENINDEHICCAFSDKKCKDGYEAKKQWLNSQLEKDFVFERLDERAKVFMETVPLKDAWVPVSDENYLYIGCFWVSGKYKKQGHAKALLQNAITRCKEKSYDGLVTIVGKKKFHFMSDTKWLLKQGFQIVDETDDDFILLVLKLNKNTQNPKFNNSVKNQDISKKGCVVYYSNRCPYTEYYVNEIFVDVCKKKDISLEIKKIDSLEEAKNSPTPATIFSLFYNGKFITTDISICMESKFNKILK